MFSISDTGIGIREDEIDPLFEAFTQVDEGFERKYQGAGLGLSIVRQLVRLMGGSMVVESDPGHGSTFNVCLPFKVAKTTEPKSAMAETILLNDTAEHSILLVEDDKINRLAVQSLLRKAGYRVDSVENGKEALAQLPEQHYSLILMDIQMPVMDGVSAIKAIRAGKSGNQHTGIPIVALTAFASEEDKKTFIQAGADDYLPKPMDIDRLSSTINRLLSSSSEH